MKKFAVFSGFLGSGKTTTMMALTNYYSDVYAKAAMISNDLGHGVNLADNKFAQLSGCIASEMTDECICYQNENLADRLDSYYKDGFEFVVSDIPGFGVGALEHVYHGLNEKYEGKYELAPFTVLVEPRTVEFLKNGTNKELTYLYNTQLVEADLIVLNKIDLLFKDEIENYISWLSEKYPNAKVIGICAADGTGIDVLAKELREGKASMRRPDIGYGGKDFMAAMSNICEYYNQYIAIVCCNTFDGNAYLSDIAARVQEKIEGTKYDIPHLKLLAWTNEGDYGKVDMVGTGREIEINHEFENPCEQIAVILNLSGVCDKEVLESAVNEVIEEVSKEYQLTLMTNKKECFGMC